MTARSFVVSDNSVVSKQTADLVLSYLCRSKHLDTWKKMEGNQVHLKSNSVSAEITQLNFIDIMCMRS